MSIRNHLALTTGALLIAQVFGTAPAHAQQGTSPAAAQRAQASASEPTELDTVTVTSRRRTEKAQDVPTPISVISGRDLEAQRIYQVQDLQQTLPNVTSQFLHARQSSVSIRGIGNNTANEGLEGSVGIYLDNVFLGRPGQAVFDLLDVEQIDLLRGPQGTLFGKNTTAGVLNITTRQPSFDPQATLETSLGNRNYRQVRGTYSGPLSDTVAFRVSAYDTHDDGWVENIVNGEKLNEINRRGLRGQVLVKPHNDFSLRLIAEYNKENSTTGTLVPYSFGPLNRGTFNSATNYTTFPQAAVAVGARPLVTDPYDYKVSLDGEQQAKVEQSAASAEASWSLGGYKLTSITAWRNWNFDPKNDLDYTNLPGLTGGFKSREEQYSQEVRLASPTGGAYDYVVGGYYYHQQTSSDNSYTTGPSILALSGGSYPNNNVVSGRGKATTDSLAAFGQATWHVTPLFDLTGGLRYTTENKKGRVVQNDLANASPFSALPVFRAWDSGELKRTDESVAGLLSASVKLAPSVLGFVNVSHGQKSGGYNVNSVASAGSAFGTQAITVDPEKANNIDLGVKSSWLDNRVQINGNLFLTKVKDYQAVTNTYYAPANIYLGVLTNVGDVTSKGFEFDIKARATSNLTLNLNGAYTLARFDSGTGPARFEAFDGVAYGRGSQSLKGNQVNGAPKWIFNVGAQYRHFLDSGIEQRVTANYAWRDDSYGDINNSIYSKIPSYGLFNLSAGWRIPQGEKSSWDVSLWVKNAFDKRYFLGLTSAGNNTYVGSAGEPRTVGATVRYDFY